MTSHESDIFQETAPGLEPCNYAVKLAGLAYLRAKQRKDVSFAIHTVVKNATVQNFIVMHLHWTYKEAIRGMTYLVALIDSEGDQKDQSDESSKEKFGGSLQSLQEIVQMFKEIVEDLKEKTVKVGERSILTKQDDFRYIIYTKAKIIVLNNPNKRSCCIDFPFRDLFSTNAFRIADTNLPSQIWDSFSDVDDSFYFKHFASRVVVLSGQAEYFELDSMIQQALKSVKEGSLPNPALFVLEYFEAVKGMCQQANGLTDNTKLVEQVIANRVAKDFNYRSLEFSNAHYEELESRLKRIAVMYVIVPGVSPDLRCCKIMNAVCSLYGERCMFLTEQILSTYPMPWLSLSCAGFCDALVMNVDNVANPESFFKQIGAPRLQTIVAVSGAVNPQLQQALLSLGRTYQQWTEEWGLEDLGDYNQRLLTFVPVSFQGREVTLSQLEATWPRLRASVSAEMLDVLTSSDMVKIGEEPRCQIVGVHHRQAFRHQCLLKPEVLQMNSTRDLIMITGVPKKTFNQFFNPSNHAEQDLLFAESSLPTKPYFTREQSSQSLYKNKMAWAAVSVSHGVDIGYDTRYNGETVFLKPPPPKMFKNICVVSYAETMALTTFGSAESRFKTMKDDNPEKNIHWISYDSGHLVWIKTHGSEDNLVKYIDKLGKECSETPVCVHNDQNREFSAWKKKIMLVVGDSGMGKTTFLKKMFLSLFNEIKLYWIIYVHFSEHKDLLKKISVDEITIFQIVEFLLIVAKGDSSKCKSFNRDFLSHSIEKSGKCVLLFDGLENLQKEEKEKAISLVKKVSESEVSQIWVSATRRDSIRVKEILKSPSMELMCYGEMDQMNYIRCYWNHVNKYPAMHPIYNPLVKLAIDKAPKFNGLSILSVPLYTFLFACTELPDDGDYQMMDLEFVRRSLNVELAGSSLYMLYRKYMKLLLSVFRLEEQEADIETDVGTKDLENNYLFEDFVPHEQPLFASDLGMKQLKYILNSTTIVPKEPPTVSDPAALGMKTSGDSSPSATFVRSPHCAKAKAQQFGDKIVMKAEAFVKIVAKRNNDVLHESVFDYVAATCFAVYHKIVGPSYLKENLLSSENRILLYFFNAVFCVGLVLHNAAIGGEAVDVAKLVDGGCPVDKLDLGGRSALHLAAQYDRVDLAKSLLEAGANATIRDSVMEWTPLQYASFSNSLEIVELLLVHGADPGDLTDLLERARAENIEIDEKKTAILNRLHEAPDLERPSFFAVSPQLLDPALLGLTEDLINNTNNCFNDAPYICTLDLSKPPVLALPRAVYKGYKYLAKFLVESGVGDPGLFSVSALHLAAYYGRKDIMRMLLYHGMNCDLCKHDGRTPLHVACQRGNVEVGNVLLKRGAEVNARDINWRTPAMLAAESGADALLQKLLRKNMETVHVRDQMGRTALYYAAKENHGKCVETLLNAGANVYVADKFESSPMQVAIARGHFDVVCMMYRFAEPTRLRDKRKSTPLHYAVAYENLEIVVGLLVRHHPVNLADCDGVTPLHIAAKRGNPKLVGILLSRGADANLMDSNKLNSFHYAILGGNELIVKKFLKTGFRVSQVAKALTLCARLAVTCGHVPVFKTLLEYGAIVDPAKPSDHRLLGLSIISENPEMTRTLLEIGFNPNPPPLFSALSALHSAVTHGAFEISSLLLEYGADPNVVSHRGVSPLHIAAEVNNVKLIKLLLSHGANTNILDKHSKPPTYTAAQEGNLEALKVLVEAKGSVLGVAEQHLTALHFATSRNRIDVIDFLLSGGISVNIMDKNGLPLLNFACLGRSDVNTIQHLINKGADISCLDVVNRSALHHASMSGKSSVVKLLVSLGLDINATDKMSCTPLHIAASRGVNSCVAVLLENGADMNVKDIRGHVPLHKAFIEKKKEIVHTFLKFRANPYSVLFSELGKVTRHAFTDVNHPIFQWGEIIDLASKLPERALRSKYLTLVSPKKCLPGLRKGKTYAVAQLVQLPPEEYLGPVEHLKSQVESGQINPALLRRKKLQNPLLHVTQKTPGWKRGPGLSTSTTGSTPRRTPPEITPRIILPNDTPTITPLPTSPKILSKNPLPGKKSTIASRNLQKLEIPPAKRSKVSLSEEICGSDTPESSTSVKSTSSVFPLFVEAVSPAMSTPNISQKLPKGPKPRKKKRVRTIESTSKDPTPKVQTCEDTNLVKRDQSLSVESIVKDKVQQLKDSNESVTKSGMTCKDTIVEISAIADETLFDKKNSSTSKDLTAIDSSYSSPKVSQEETKASSGITPKYALDVVCSKTLMKNELKEKRLSISESFAIAPKMLPDNVLQELQLKYAEKFGSLKVSEDEISETTQMSSREMAEMITNYYKKVPSPEQASPEIPAAKNRWKYRKSATSKSIAMLDSFARTPVSVSQDCLSRPTAKESLDVTNGNIGSYEAHTPVLP